VSSKTQELLTDQIWNIGSYGHIIFGGVAWLSWVPNLIVAFYFIKRQKIKLAAQYI